MVDREMLGHAIVEVPGLDGVLVLVEPVHSIPPCLTLIGRHDVLGLADLAGDVVLCPGAGVASAVQATLEGALWRKLDPRNRDFWFSYNSPQNLAHWNRTAILCMGVGSV